MPAYPGNVCTSSLENWEQLESLKGGIFGTWALFKYKILALVTQFNLAFMFLTCWFSCLNSLMGVSAWQNRGSRKRKVFKKNKTICPKNCWTMTYHVECTSIHIFLCSFWVLLLESSICVFNAFYIYEKECACSQAGWTALPEPPPCLLQYNYLLFWDQAVMAKLEFSILHRECKETHCWMINIFSQALETLQRFSLQEIIIFPAKRALHYELIIKSWSLMYSMVFFQLRLYIQSQQFSGLSSPRYSIWVRKAK